MPLELCPGADLLQLSLAVGEGALEAALASALLVILTHLGLTLPAHLLRSRDGLLHGLPMRHRAVLTGRTLGAKADCVDLSLM